MLGVDNGHELSVRGTGKGKELREQLPVRQIHKDSNADIRK